MDAPLSIQCFWLRVEGCKKAVFKYSYKSFRSSLNRQEKAGLICVITHSQYWNFIWEWRFHSRTAAMDFPLRDKIMGGYPIKMKFTFPVRMAFQFLLRMTFNFKKDKRSRLYQGQILGQGQVKVSSSSRSPQGQISRSLEGQLKVKVNFQGQGQLKVKVVQRSNFKVKVISRSFQGQRSRSSEGQSLGSMPFQCQWSNL